LGSHALPTRPSGKERLPGSGVAPGRNLFILLLMPEKIEYPKIDAALVKRATDVVKLAEKRGRTIVTAESCTGGLLAAVLAEAPGAGKQLQGGFVTYTKDQKTIALGIPRALLERESAVSEAVARAMAESALGRSIADLSVAITGVAGPESDEDGNPVGLVHIAAARRASSTLHQEHRFGDVGRGKVLYQTVMGALDLLERCATDGQDRVRAAE
jgi:nicotinamide-nucleotide amidase